MNRESRIWEWVQKAPGACAEDSVAFGLPSAALGCPRTSVLRCFMRLELPGALYLLSCRWDAWKGAPGQAQGCPWPPGLVFVSKISDPEFGTIPRRIPCCLEGSQSPGGFLISQNLSCRRMRWSLDTGGWLCLVPWKNMEK